MAAEKYTTPALNLAAFHCPLCGVLAKQDWFPLKWVPGNLLDVPGWRLAVCQHCNQGSFWRNGVMTYPNSGNAPLPNPDLPEAIRADYDEARSISNLSPRGAAALLRLAIQKLCKHLGEEGHNPNDDIAGLVKKGLPVRVQQSLDAVRVIGNEAVHPGTIDLRDNPAMADALFGLVNFIAEKMLTEPKHIDALYAALPESKRAAIEKRDK